MIRRLIFLFFVTISVISGVKAQTVQDTIYHPEIFYSNAKTYVIEDIDVRGIGDLYDKETLIQLSRLYVGQSLKIPGSEMTNAIKNLYKQGMFSDVVIELEKVVGDKAYLAIYLTTRNRLSMLVFHGVKKPEETKLKEKLGLAAGVQVTDNMIASIERVVDRFYKDKGYYNQTVKVLQRDDTSKNNFVIVDITVEKKDKIKIKEIEIVGNEGVKDGKLKASMKKTKEKSLINFFKSSKYIASNFDDDKYNLIDKYNEKGFRDASIISDTVVQVSPSRVKIKIEVDEGKKYYFNNISWVGNTVYDSQALTDFLGIEKGEVYNKKHFTDKLSGEDGVGDFFYYNRGYLFYRAIPVESIVGDDSIDMEIRIMEGPQATINRINITGNTTTHEHVIRRELYIYPGELFSKEDIMRSMRELANMGHFDPEKIAPTPKPNIETGTVDIDLHVEEKSNDKIELSGGWGAGMIIGSLGLSFSNFSMRNIFNWDSYRPLPQGDGQTLSLKAQTNGKYYSTFSVSFMEPWLGGKKPNSFSFSAYYSRQTGYSSNYKNSYYYNNSSSMYDSDQLMSTFGISVGLGRRIKWPDDYFTMYNEVSYQRYTLKNWAYYIMTDGNSNSLSFSTTLKRSSIDNPIFTRSGSEFSLAVSFTLPYSLFSDRDYSNPNMKDKVKYRWIEYHKWKFVGKAYMPLDKNEKLILYTGIQYGYLGYYNKFKRSPFEGFEMGGDGMSGYSLYGREYVGLRGYENGSLTNAGSNFMASSQSDANVYSKFTIEVRYPLSLAQSATIYALTFLEAGNSWATLKEFEPFNLYRSAGVGLRVLLPMFGLLGIDWGYGFDEVPSRSGASGSQFHFVLGQEF